MITSCTRGYVFASTLVGSLRCYGIRLQQSDVARGYADHAFQHLHTL